MSVLVEEREKAPAGFDRGRSTRTAETDAQRTRPLAPRGASLTQPTCNKIPPLGEVATATSPDDERVQFHEKETHMKSMYLRSVYLLAVVVAFVVAAGAGTKFH